MSVDQDGVARQRSEFVALTSRGIGASAQPEVIVEEQGNNFMHRTVISLVNMPVTVGNTTGASFGSKKLYDFPECRYQLLGGNCDLVFDWSDEATIVATGSGDASLGTTATAEATLAGTEVDHMAQTAMLDPFVAGVGNLSGNLVKDTEFDGSATAKDLYLNVIIDDADVSDGQAGAIVYVSGTITMVWINYGDH